MALGIWSKIKHKWIKLRLRPIHVYCLHHVCEKYDAASMHQGDWLQIDEFKNKVSKMQQNGVEFISLTDAYFHICNEWFRRKKYAVLTFDDGYASLKELLPWLEEQRIPAVLFINGRYLDGKSCRENIREQYLTHKELFELTSPLIEIGSHGWEHIEATKMTEQEFEQSIESNALLLSQHPRYIPFYAYTYGNHSMATDKILCEKKLISVLMDGEQNYNEKKTIHRELLR